MKMTTYDIVMSYNQIDENVYCNSDAYDQIYDKTVLDAQMLSLSGWFSTHILQPNIVFFSKLLRVNRSTNNIPLRYQYHHLGEQNRRELKLSVRVPNRNNLVLFSLTYTYQFDYHSPGKKYAIGDTVIINRSECTCIRDQLPNHMYIFITKRRNAFHFTFHPPAPTLPKQLKTKGAFHLNIDSFADDPPHVVPYRPFLVDPRTSVPDTRTHFLSWDAFTSTDGYFTSTVVPGMEELSSFVRENPAVPVVHTARGHSVHYLEDIVKPIYDKLVTDVLNPLVATLPWEAIPAAVKYDPAYPLVPCRGKGVHLRTLKTHAKQERTLRHQGRDLWMGGHRRTKKCTK